MPRLIDVVLEADAERFRESAAFVHAERAVVALKLTTGAPCDGHSELFAPWPGPEQHVQRWFILDNGKAVGVDEVPDGDRRFAVAEAPAV